MVSGADGGAAGTLQKGSWRASKVDAQIFIEKFYVRCWKEAQRAFLFNEQKLDLED